MTQIIVDLISDDTYTDKVANIVVSVDRSMPEAQIVMQGQQGPPGNWKQVTQAQYDALSPPDPAILYVVVG